MPAQRFIGTALVMVQAPRMRCAHLPADMDGSLSKAHELFDLDA
jgi:hypothetical protein